MTDKTIYKLVLKWPVQLLRDDEKERSIAVGSVGGGKRVVEIALGVEDPSVYYAIFTEGDGIGVPVASVSGVIYAPCCCHPFCPELASYIIHFGSKEMGISEKGENTTYACRSHFSDVLDEQWAVGDCALIEKTNEHIIAVLDSGEGKVQ